MKKGLLFLYFYSMVFATTTGNQRTRLSVDDEGNGVAVWEEFKDHHFVIKSTLVTASEMGGDLSVPVILSSIEEDSFFSDVKVNQFQKAIAVWQKTSDEQVFVLQAVVGDLSEETWGEVKTIAIDVSMPKIGIDAEGNGLVIWQRKSGNQFIISAANYSAETGHWGATLDISAPSRTFLFPQIAVNSAGNAVAIWQQFDGKISLIQTAYLPFGFDSWSSPITLSDPLHSASNPQIVLNDSGKVVAIWQTSNGVNLIIQATSSNFGNTWVSPTNLSTDEKNALNPEIVINGNGKAIAIWQQFNGEKHIIQSATLTDTLWSDTTNLSNGTLDASKPKVAINSSGDAAAVWQVIQNNETVIQSAFLRAGMPWSVATDVSVANQKGSLPQISLTSSGKALATWQAKNNPSIQIARSTQSLDQELILDDIVNAKDLND